MFNLRAIWRLDTPRRCNCTNCLMVLIRFTFPAMCACVFFTHKIIEKPQMKKSGTGGCKCSGIRSPTDGKNPMNELFIINALWTKVGAYAPESWGRRPEVLEVLLPDLFYWSFVSRLGAYAPEWDKHRPWKSINRMDKILFFLFLPFFHLKMGAYLPEWQILLLLLQT